MNTRKVLLIGLLIVMLLLPTGLASARVERIPVNAIEYTCMKTPGETWQSGNVLHVRGQVNENVVVYPDGTPWGLLTAVISYDLHLRTGQITATAWPDFAPDGAGGGYAGVAAIRIEDFGATTAFAKGTLPGYGEFQGQLMRLDLSGLPEGPGDAAYCEGHGSYFGTTLWEGYIERN